jgi:hypothetical protein
LYFAVGSFTQVNGQSYNRIVSFDYSGAINTAFNVGTGFDSEVAEIKIDDVKKRILCSGGFSTYKGVAVGKIAMLDFQGNLL